MNTTFGAPAGGRNGRIGGSVTSGSLASYPVDPGGTTSAIGNDSRRKPEPDISHLPAACDNGRHDKTM
jgi:hypothetical protein